MWVPVRRCRGGRRGRPGVRGARASLGGARGRQVMQRAVATGAAGLAAAAADLDAAALAGDALDDAQVAAGRCAVPNGLYRTSRWIPRSCTLLRLGSTCTGPTHTHQRANGCARCAQWRNCAPVRFALLSLQRRARRPSASAV